MHEAMRGGVRIHWREHGQGPERLLALHCGLGQSTMWRKLSEVLPPTVRITAPDLPGHGKSGAFPKGVDVHDAAFGCMLPFLSRPAHLLGHSFGATVALRMALAAPEQVLSLTLVEPVFFAAAADGPVKTAHRKREAACIGGTPDDMHAAAMGFNSLWGGGTPWEDLKPEARDAMARVMPFVRGTERSLWDDGAGMLAPGGLEALAMPVTLLRGSESLPIVAEIHKGLLARLPHGREQVIDGAGHMLVVTHADHVAATLDAVLDTTAPG